MMIRTRLIACVASALLAFFSALAAEEALVNIRFQTYPVVTGEALEDLYYESSPGRFEALSFRRFQRSTRTFAYAGLPVLTFYRPDEAAETGFRPVSEVAVPPEAGSCLVFVLPAAAATEEAAPPIRLAIINDSFDRLPDDSVSFLNFTNAPLLGVLGELRLDLGPGLSGPYSIRDQLNEPVTVGLAVRRGEDLRKVLQNRWTFRPGERNLVILTPPRRERSFRIQAFHLIDSEERASLESEANAGSPAEASSGG